LGLVDSLNRPGANVTGRASLMAELAPKRSFHTVEFPSLATISSDHFGILKAANANVNAYAVFFNDARSEGVKEVVISKQVVDGTAPPLHIYADRPDRTGEASA
jgi:hypothetical protein